MEMFCKNWGNIKIINGQVTEHTVDKYHGLFGSFIKFLYMNLSVIDSDYWHS